MNRASRLRIMLGVSIIGVIGILVGSKILPIVAVFLILLSCIRFPYSPPPNYTEIYGPPDEEGGEDASTPFNTTLDEDDIVDLELENDEDSEST